MVTGYLSSRPARAYPLTSRTVASSALFTSRDIAYDVALGGMAFLTAVHKEDKQITRSWLQLQKDQVDNSGEPGERMLGPWWYRSQSSFHLGTDIKFVEPAQEPTLAYRFQDSRGVDPWTAGELTLLRETENKQATTANDMVFVRSAKTGASDLDAVLCAHGANLRLISDAANTVITGGNGATQIIGLAEDGTNYYIRAGTNIYAGALPTGAGALAWSGLAAAAQVNAGVYPMLATKQRLMVADANKLYELVPPGTGAAVPAAHFTHPVTAWRWTAMAEGPNAIYAAGTDGKIEQGTPRVTGTNSAVYKITVSSTGTLNTPIVVFTPPPGEFVTALAIVGNTIAIGTNKGVRLGRLDAETTGGSGDFVIEGVPLDIPHETSVRALAVRDRFIYAALGDGTGEVGLARIDVGTEIKDGLFPWAYDVLATTTYGTGDLVVGIAPFGNSDRMAFAIQGVTNAGAFWLEKAATKVASGWIETGAIRFNTLERKVFRYLDLRVGTALDGGLTAAYVDPAGTEHTIATFAEGAAEPVDLLISENPLQFAAIKVTLNRNSTDLSVGAHLQGYQVRALPWAQRTPVFIYPLMCYDFERDRNNVLVGHEGWAFERLEQIEAIMNTGTPTVFQDLRNDRDYLVLIEDYQFEQVEAQERKSATGGILEVRMRVIQ